MQHFDPLFSLYYVKKGFIRPQISALGAGFETRPPFLPFWARFCRYFWLFLAISGLGASPGGPGSKLIILRATGESQETVLLGGVLNAIFVDLSAPYRRTPSEC